MKDFFRWIVGKEPHGHATLLERQTWIEDEEQKQMQEVRNRIDRVQRELTRIDRRRDDSANGRGQP